MVLIVRGLIVRHARIVVFMTKNIRKEFGKAVRRLRIQRNISQEQLAHDCGLDRSYIGGVERGERNPSLLVLGKMASGLNITLSELFAECAVPAARRSRRPTGAS